MQDVGVLLIDLCWNCMFVVFTVYTCSFLVFKFGGVRISNRIR